MIHANIHLISPGCLRPSIALQCAELWFITPFISIHISCCFRGPPEKHPELVDKLQASYKTAQKVLVISADYCDAILNQYGNIINRTTFIQYLPIITVKTCQCFSLLLILYVKVLVYCKKSSSGRSTNLECLPPS